MRLNPAREFVVHLTVMFHRLSISGTNSYCITQMPVIVTDVCGTRVNVHPYLTTCEAVVNFIRFGTRRVRQKERNFLTS